MENRFANLELELPSCSQVVQKQALPSSNQGQCLAEASAAFNRAEFESALRWYGRCLEYGLEQTAAWIGQVQCLLELSRPSEARIWADKALERFVDEPVLLSLKAMALGRLGDPTVALAFSDAAVERDNHHPIIWLARADILLAKGARTAEHCFVEAMRSGLGDATVSWLAGRIRRYWGQFAGAAKFFQEALAVSPDRYAVWVDLGLCQTLLGLIEPATRAFHQALALNPGYQPAQAGLNSLRTTSAGARITGWWRRWTT